MQLGDSFVAAYQDANFLTRVQDGAFDKDHPPGVQAPWAGIYRCMGCHREVGIAQGHNLPPQPHHTHTTQQGAIRWRLIVYADHNPK
jgi:hypothetical protein